MDRLEQCQLTTPQTSGGSRTAKSSPKASVFSDLTCPNGD
jgi:hypothetical protein